MILGAVIFFGKQAIRYYKVYGKQRDNYIMATFICLGLSQMFFTFHDAKKGFLKIISLYGIQGSVWAKDVLRWQIKNMKMLVVFNNLFEIIGIALQ